MKSAGEVKKRNPLEKGKTAKRVFLIFTIVCGALAVLFDIAAVCMQVMVSGENLLTMDSRLGYILAVNYRWVTLAAVFLTVVAAAMLTLFILNRRRRKKAVNALEG